MSADAAAPTDTPTDAAGEAQEPPEGAQEPPEQAASREAMRYRLRLRETEAQLTQSNAAIEALRSEIDRLHRAEIERMAASPAYAMSNPADLWLVASLDDLRAEDGRLDDGKVADVLRDVLRERPQWRTSSPGMDGGVRSGGIPRQREASFGALLKGRR